MVTNLSKPSLAIQATNSGDTKELNQTFGRTPWWLKEVIEGGLIRSEWQEWEISSTGRAVTVAQSENERLTRIDDGGFRSPIGGHLQTLERIAALEIRSGRFAR